MRPTLKRNGRTDQCQADIEREIHFLCLSKENHGDQNAVDRLQVVTQIHGKSRESLESLHLKNEHPNRTERRHQTKVREVERTRHDRINLKELKVDRNDQTHHKETRQNLVKQKRHQRIVKTHSTRLN